MKTTRRGFLKILGFGSAAVVVPAKTIEACALSVENAFKSEDASKSNAFNPAWEWGNSVHLDGKTSITEDKEIIKTLKKDLQKIIPRRYMSRVQFLKTPLQDYRRDQSMAWYYCPGDKRKYYHGPQGKWRYQYGRRAYLWVKA